MGPQAAKVAAARRRMGLSRLARLMGPILLIGAGASLLLVGLLKYAGHFMGAGDWHPLLWTLVALFPLIAGLAIGLVRARRLWPTNLEAASRLDEVSRTHDAIGTAMTLSERGQARGFEAIALREGEKASERADVRSVASIVLGWTWPVAAFLALGAGLMVWLAPVRTPRPERTPVVLRPAPPEAVQEASERLAQMKELVQEAAPDPEMVREELAEIEALERELMEGTREPEETIAAATETLERAAQEAQSQAERERQTTESLQERLRRVESERFEAARQLAEKLQESDFDGAAQEAERLLNELAQDPTQAEPIAQELRDLADEIDPSASEQDMPSQPNEPAQPPETPSADEIRERLEQEGVPPEAAERLAEEQRQELEEQQEQEAAEREARERAEEIAEKLRETADQADPQQLTEPDSNQSEESQPGQDQQQPDESQPGESQEPTPEGNERSQGQEREPGQTGQDEPAQEGQGESEPSPEPGQPGQEEAPEQGQGEENAGDEGQPREGGEQPGESPAPSQQPGSQEDQREQGQGEQDQNEQGQSESAEDTQGEQGQGQEGQGGEGEEPGMSPSGQPGEQPGFQPGQNPAQPGQQPGLQPGQQPTPGEGAAPQQGEQEGSESENGGTGSGTGSGDQKGLGDVLRENAQREQSAQEMQERANRLREESRRITDPEGAFDPLTDAVPPSNPWDGDTQFVDARREPGERQPEDERTIAEWFTPGDMEGESPTRGRITPGETVRSAGERAQRAIEQQNVPRRHAEMIKRVFDRLSREAESAGASASPVRDAEDAP